MSEIDRTNARFPQEKYAECFCTIHFRQCSDSTLWGIRMTVGGAIVQAIFSGFLLLVPAAILKPNRLYVSLVLSFLTIFSSCKLAGLLLAVPVTLVLLLYFLWVRFLSQGTNGAKNVLFWTTVVLAGVYLATQIIHLPVRFALGQSTVLVAANVVGIILAVCLLCAPLEFKMSRRMRSDSNPETSFVDDQEAEDLLAVSDTPGAMAPLLRYEVPDEPCPYCERVVKPDSEGRCPACHRPIA